MWYAETAYTETRRRMQELHDHLYCYGVTIRQDGPPTAEGQRRFQLVLFGAVACLMPVAGAVQQPTFRSSTQVVAVYATVVDRSGRPVTSLRQDDFEVLDNGRQATITVFATAAQPLTLLLMFDTSASIAPSLDKVRQAALACIDALQPGDRARIGSFGTEIAISPHLTDDKTVLRRVVREELWPGFSTRLWSALRLGLTQLSHDAGRRALVVLSDGVDTSRSPAHASMAGGNQSEVMNLARQDDWMVYAVTVHGGLGTGISRALTDVVEETGGRAVHVGRAADLGGAYAGVMDELRHQYLLGMSAEQPDGTIHRLEVRSRTAGLTVRARKGYRAQREPR